jgi:endonuclease/exonuclease/phosphatase family metal-dependent hydrolase
VHAGRFGGSGPYRLGVRYLRTTVAWLLAAPLAGFALVRLFGLEHGWPLVPLLAFTPYAALAGAVPVTAGFLLRQRWAAGVALVATLTLGGLVLPRALGGADHAGGQPLHVLSANLRIGGADTERLLALVRTGHVDLLALQEFTFAARDRLVAAGLGALLPYGASHPTDGVDGSALYSRYPLTDTGYRPLPGGFGQAYATLQVPGAPPVLVESAHPAAPSAADQLGYWRAGLATEPRATPHGPVRLLLGDFNATLDHAPLRQLIGSGYRDAASVMGDGFTPSWPYDGKPLPPVTIDHVLADPRIGVRAFAATRIPDTDHRAVSATLALPRIPLTP